MPTDGEDHANDDPDNTPQSTKSLTPDQDLLTVTEVATALRVSKMTVYRLVTQGDIDSIRAGKSIRILKAALTRYLNATRVG
jgi:excisionase family DNA binding protein